MCNTIPGLEKFCLEETHNISFSNNVSKIKKTDDFESLDNQEKFYSKKIYDSRSVTMESDGLKQHFNGNIISVKEGHQIKNARLMDFRVTQDQGPLYIYSLWMIHVF